MNSLRRVFSVLKPAPRFRFSTSPPPATGLGEGAAGAPADAAEVASIKEALRAHEAKVQASSAPAQPSLLLGFTCKQCSTRSHRVMSQRAYKHGIVLMECPCCRTRHLIADNLGWFKDTPNAARRIEDMTDVVGEIRRELGSATDSSADAPDLVEFIAK